MTAPYALQKLVARAVPGSRGRALRRRYRDLDWLSEADVAFVSYPKSGRTFVRAMLSRLYEREFGLDERQLLEFPLLQAAPPTVPRILFTHDSDALLRPDEIAIDKRAYSGRKLVLLARHPGDVALSRYHHLKHRSRDATRRRLADQPIDAFVWTERGGIPSNVAYLNAWAQFARERGDACVLRYEDILAEPRPNLERLAKFVGLDSDPPRIEEAVEFARLDNLKARERQGYFESDRLRTRSGGGPLSGKVRTGKAGGYRASLAPDNVARVDAYVASNLDPVFDYSADARPAKKAEGDP